MSYERRHQGNATTFREARRQFERWSMELAERMLAEAKRLDAWWFGQELPPHDDTGDERHGDWDCGRAERW